MGQRGSNAASKVAQTKLGKEECARSMGQNRNNAAVKGAQTNPSKEESA